MITFLVEINQISNGGWVSDNKGQVKLNEFNNIVIYLYDTCSQTTILNVSFLKLKYSDCIV